MLNSKTVQLCALLESLIDQHGHNTSRLIQGLIKKLPEYFMGDKAQENGNQILLKKMDDNWEDIEVGILEDVYKRQVYTHYNEELDYEYFNTLKNRYANIDIQYLFEKEVREMGLRPL